MASTPYDELIGNGDPSGLQERYEKHRTQRNAAQREKLLSDDLRRLDLDQTLYKLVNPRLYPGFIDERHCLVFWARPPQALRDLISDVQRRLKAFAPKIAERVSQMRPKLEEITDFTYYHRARLLKPKLGYDASAIALSFVPAAGEGQVSNHSDDYSYHHLRRDVWTLCKETGVEVASRYVLPSAHLTVARFVTNGDHSSAVDYVDEPGGDGKLDREKMKAWLDTLEEVNHWLEQTYWPKASGDIPAGGQWIVGEGRGLDCKASNIWYGRDSEDSVRVGKGF